MSMKNLRSWATVLLTLALPACTTVQQPVQPEGAGETEKFKTNIDGYRVLFDASDLQGNFQHWQWDFGDGSTGEGQQVEHRYISAGSYHVILEATTAQDRGHKIEGVVVLWEQRDESRNQPPVALLSAAPTTGKAPLAVTFTSNSYDVDGKIVSLTWTFGDGETASGQAARHVFERAGVYRVTLSVEDDQGATGQAQVTITVGEDEGANGDIENQPPRAAFIASPTSGSAPLDVVFTSTSTDTDGTITRFEWDFGDGNIAVGEQVAHTFLESGAYTVTLNVTDDQGATSQAQQAIKVAEASNKPPVAAIKAAPTSGPAPLKVTFASASADPDGMIVSHRWNFGDGEAGEGEEIEHRYVKPGTYSVTLVVTDDKGATGLTRTTIDVSESETPNQFPRASFTASPTSGPAALEVVFTSTSTDPDGIIIRQDWDFGDGNTAIGSEVRHVFHKPGSYTVALVVTDDDGARSRAIAIIEVSLP